MKSEAGPRGAAAFPAPAAWLEEIRGLYRQGRVAEAEARLRAFRDAYPGHPLPDDLGR